MVPSPLLARIIHAGTVGQRGIMYPIVQIPVNNLTKKVYLSSLSIGSTEDNSQLFCLLHNGYLGVLVH